MVYRFFPGMGKIGMKCSIMTKKGVPDSVIFPYLGLIFMF